MPCTESYFNNNAVPSLSPVALIATTSTSGLLIAARTTHLPIRPKPLIPTLTAIVLSSSKELYNTKNNKLNYNAGIFSNWRIPSAALIKLVLLLAL